MRLQLIKKQVTNGVTRLGDWIAYGGGGSPLVGSRYLYENRTPPGAAIGTIYHNTGETELYVNSQDLDGNNHYNAISTLKIGDKITVETQTGTLILRPAYVGGGLWQFFLDAWLALPDGEYLVTLERVPVVPPSEFTPSSLFASGEEGAWYDPSDLTTMFQDRAGTTPVTADGQTVGKILDKSGRNNHATAPSDAARPLYKTSGGYSWLQFDGVDDALSTAAIDFTAGNSVSLFAGVYKPNLTAKIIVELSTNSGGNSGTFYIVAGTDSSADYSSLIRSTTNRVSKWTTQSFPDTAVISATHQINGQASTIRRNGVNGTPDSTAMGVANLGTYPMFIGSRNNVGLLLDGNIYSLIVRGALSTAGEITDTETWVNSKTGAY